MFIKLTAIDNTPALLQVTEIQQVLTETSEKTLIVLKNKAERYVRESVQEIEEILKD